MAHGTGCPINGTYPLDFVCGPLGHVMIAPAWAARQPCRMHGNEMAENSAKMRKAGDPGAKYLANAPALSAALLDLVRLLARQAAREMLEQKVVSQG